MQFPVQELLLAAAPPHVGRTIDLVFTMDILLRCANDWLAKHTVGKACFSLAMLPRAGIDMLPLGPSAPTASIIESVTFSGLEIIVDCSARLCNQHVAGSLYWRRSLWV